MICIKVTSCFIGPSIAVFLVNWKPLPVHFRGGWVVADLSRDELILLQCPQGFSPLTG